LFILTHILLVLNFPGSVDADIGLGGKLKSHLMAGCQVCWFQKLSKLLIFLQVTNENI